MSPKSARRKVNWTAWPGQRSDLGSPSTKRSEIIS